MTQLICHLIGDYVIQNHWMATRKTSSFPVAMLHAALYGLPFLLLTRSPWALAVIVLTHAVIDRWRLARYWCEWWGVGYWPSRLVGLGYRCVYADERAIDSPLPRQDPPPFLAVCLLIIVDNTAHLAINFAAMRWL